MASLSTNARRFGIRSRLFVFAAILLLLGGAGAGLSALIDEDRLLFPGELDELEVADLDAEFSPPAQVEAGREVLIARRNLDSGVRFDNPPKYLEFGRVANAPENAITRYKDVQDRTLSRALRQGEVLTVTDLVATGVSVAYSLPKGMRAVGVRVNTEGNSAGFMHLPMSRVDVVSTVRRGGGDSFSQVLLEDVLVIAAEPEVKRDVDGRAMPSAVATLALPPEDALRITLGRELGTLTLVPRKQGDRQRIDPAKVTARDILKNDVPRNPEAPLPPLAANDPQAGAEEGKQPQPNLKIIRTGDMEFEVESFDAGLAIVRRLAEATGGGLCRHGQQREAAQRQGPRRRGRAHSPGQT